MTAIILAGGLGTRIRAVHPTIPKPMIPIAGRPFLEWQLEWLHTQGIADVLLSIGYRAEAIVTHFQQPRVIGVTTRCVAEDQPRGTAGAARVAAQQVATSWCLVCNGDSLCPADLAPLCAAAHEDAPAVLLAARVDDARDYGTVLVDAAGCVTGFLEKGAAGGPGLVNAGVYRLRTAWLRDLPATIPLSFERDIFPHMAHGCLRAAITTTPFLDIGVPERLAVAAEFVAGKVARCKSTKVTKY
ncbi:MAG: nucleotidyltransferase family protein [bacterium]|nr:nucleotidyltransferase family protein [bacterium]